jgi:hypothetical protein
MDSALPVHDRRLKPAGAVVGGIEHHEEPGIRFGVVVAAEPTGWVARLLDDDPAVWGPALAEICAAAWPTWEPFTTPTGTAQPPLEGSAARCDYCARLFEPRHARGYWEHADTLDDGTGVLVTGTYCSEPCGQAAVHRAGSTRG